VEERIDPKLNSSTSHSSPYSDASAPNEAVERNIEAAKFALRTNFVNLQVGVGGEEETKKMRVLHP
jgi:hypothetical protein